MSGNGKTRELFKSAFDSVWVVESPPPGLDPSGRPVYEMIENELPCSGFDEFQPRYCNVASEEQLWESLSALEDEVLKNGKHPILHLDIAHGCREDPGFSLANDDFIPLPELKETLVAINRATGFDLLLTVATCFGGFVAGLCRPPGGAPACAAIGPVKSVKSQDLIDAYSAFYRELLQTGNVDSAVDALDHEKPCTFNKDMFDARGLFVKGYQTFVSVVENPQALQQLLSQLPAGSTLRPRLRRVISKARKPSEEGDVSSFEQVKKEYFMLDEFPSNRERFQLDQISGSL